MIVKKLFLVAAIILTIFVLYTGFGTFPDIEVTKINGYSWGANVTSYPYLKLITFAVWMLYLLFPTSNDK